MAALSEILIPGEKVLYRATFPREFAWALAFWAIYIGGMSADMMYRYPPEKPADDLFFLGVFFLPMFIVPVAIGLAVMWVRFPAWAITNRRIIALGGPWRSKREEIALDDIEDARFAESQLILEGSGRTLKIRALRIPAKILSQSLGRWFPDAGKPKPRLGHIPERGETVLQREPTLWLATLPAGLIAFGGYMLLGGLWPLATGAEADISDTSVGLIFVLMVVWGVFDLRAHTFWTTVVTDRRLLRGLAHDPARYEEFPLATVEAVPPAIFGDRLFVKLRGEEVQLTAKGKTADRVREAIEQAKRGEQWRG